MDKSENAVPAEILAVAQSHIAGLRPVEGFVWRLGKEQQVPTGWYFDYIAEWLPSNPPGPGSGFGYAPGFVVAEAGSVQVIAWHELDAIHGQKD